MLDPIKVKRWYEKGFWSEKMVLDAVAKGKLTQEQADEIIGKPEPIPEIMPDELNSDFSKPTSEESVPVPEIASSEEASENKSTAIPEESQVASELTSENADKTVEESK